MGKLNSILNHDELNRLREEIDKIDRKIITLLARRMGFSCKIGELKRSLNLPLFDPGREEALLKKLVELNDNSLLAPAMLRAIYREILAASRHLQYPIKVAYLGPDWSYCYVAAFNFFGHQVDYLPCNSIAAVFDVVSRRQCNVGVVPVESSVEGSIGVTMDFLLDSNLHIVRECYIAMEYSLAGFPESLKEVKQIYGHPRSFNLCRKWIAENLPGVAFLECSSTSEAARLCSARQDSAALCNLYAAHYYQLNVLAENISDYPDAYTRFFALSLDKTPPSGDDKTSIVFATYDTPGALYDALEPFAKQGVNLVRIESRSSKLWPHSYLFFADLEGHEESQQIKESLQEMKKRLPLVKVLGSYPKAMSNRPIRINKETVRSETVGLDLA